MTIDQLIEGLQRAREKSVRGGDTVVVLCMRDSGVVNPGLDEVHLDQDKDGALVELIAYAHEFSVGKAF